MFRYRLRKLEAFLRRLDAGGHDRPAPRRLQTAQDVLELLHEQVEALRAVPEVSTSERARAIGYLAGLARRTIETHTLADRLAMLEQVLKQRKEVGK